VCPLLESFDLKIGQRAITGRLKSEDPRPIRDGGAPQSHLPPEVLRGDRLPRHYDGIDYSIPHTLVGKPLTLAEKWGQKKLYLTFPSVFCPHFSASLPEE